MNEQIRTEGQRQRKSDKTETGARQSTETLLLQHTVTALYFDTSYIQQRSHGSQQGKIKAVN